MPGFELTEEQREPESLARKFDEHEIYSRAPREFDEQEIFFPSIYAKKKPSTAGLMNFGRAQRSRRPYRPRRSR